MVRPRKFNVYRLEHQAVNLGTFYIVFSHESLDRPSIQLGERLAVLICFTYIFCTCNTNSCENLFDMFHQSAGLPIDHLNYYRIHKHHFAAIGRVCRMKSVMYCYKREAHGKTMTC